MQYGLTVHLSGFGEDYDTDEYLPSVKIRRRLSQAHVPSPR